MQFCQKLCTRHTFWSCLTRCIHTKWIQPELKALQSGHGMRDGRTDGSDRRTDGRSETNTPPQKKKKTNNFVVYNKGWIYLYIPGKFVLRMCISKGNSYIRQMQRTSRKVLHEIYPNVSKFFPCFFFFFFSNNFRFTSYKYVTFEYPKVHRPTYLIWFLLMISRQTNHKFEYGMVS